ncbi:MAG: hypothetical protein P8P29_00135 [Flavobacteriaceae bacterium]|nr:hypothetical protein [Flavobacteriaceae bacterium]
MRKHKKIDPFFVYAFKLHAPIRPDETHIFLTLREFDRFFNCAPHKAKKALVYEKVFINGVEMTRVPYDKETQSMIVKWDHTT